MKKIPFEPDRFSKTLTMIRGAPGEGVAPSMSVGMLDFAEPDVLRTAASGELYSVFDISSVTKVLVMATLSGILLDRRWIHWELPVQAVIPEFRFREIGIHHLLSHCAGYAACRDYFSIIADRLGPAPLWKTDVPDRQAVMRELLIAENPEAPPGERVLYSDIGPLILGFVLEEIFQMPVDEAAQRLIFAGCQFEIHS